MVEKVMGILNATFIAMFANSRKSADRASETDYCYKIDLGKRMRLFSSLLSRYRPFRTSIIKFGSAALILKFSKSYVASVSFYYDTSLIDLHQSTLDCCQLASNVSIINE